MNGELANQTSQQEKVPAIVYHYTSMDALMNIVKTRSLWCTAISYLNDAGERQFLIDAVRRRLPDLKKENRSLDRNLSVDAVQSQDQHAVTDLADEAFVTSFAAKPDSLMHWRSYCPQQSGVALGFRTDCLAEARINEVPQPGMIVPGIAFGPVKYIDVDKQTSVDDAIKRVMQLANLYLQKAGWPSERFAEAFPIALKLVACISKHRKFEVEDEYRLLLAGPKFRENNLRFRTVRSSLVPYIEMHIPNRAEPGVPYDWSGKGGNPWNAIERVIIGPTANMDLTQRALKAFFALYRIPVEIEPSVIPYRDW